MKECVRVFIGGAGCTRNDLNTGFDADHNIPETDEMKGLELCGS